MGELCCGSTPLVWLVGRRLEKLNQPTNLTQKELGGWGGGDRGIKTVD